MKRYLILGTGEMGMQIAQLIFSSCKESELYLFSSTGKNLEEKLNVLESSILKLAKFGKLKYSFESSDLNRVKFVSDFEIKHKPNFIFECLQEDKNEKLSALKTCSNIYESSIITSNTSSLSIDELGNSLNLPARFFGCHFFNPVMKTRFAEIIPHKKSTSENLTILKNELNLYLKDYVIINDSPGFVVNKILISMIESGIELHINEGISFEQVDRSLKLGANFIAGPFEIADLIGLDVVVKIMRNTKKIKYIDFLQERVLSNKLGKKTGIGFYTY